MNYCPSLTFIELKIDFLAKKLRFCTFKQLSTVGRDHLCWLLGQVETAAL